MVYKHPPLQSTPSLTPMLRQLRLRPLRQLLPQPLVPHILRPGILLRHRNIISPALRLSTRRAPQLAPGAVLHARRRQRPDEELVQNREPGMRFEELAREARLDGAGVHGDAFDARVALREVLGEEDVGELGVPVASPGAVVGHGPTGVGECEAAFGSEFVADGGEVDDADVRVGFFGGFEQCGEEFGGEAGVADVVGAELDLVAFLSGAGGDGHDAGVVHEDVEAWGRGVEGVGGFFDGFEGGEIELEEGDVGIGNFFLDGGNCGFGFRGGSGSEVDVSVTFG